MGDMSHQFRLTQTLAKVIQLVPRYFYQAVGLCYLLHPLGKILRQQPW